MTIGGWNPDYDLGLVSVFDDGRATRRQVEVGTARPAVHVLRRPSPEDVAREFTADVIGLGGGNAMIAWATATPPPRIAVLGIAGATRKALEKLAKSSFLAQIRRLVVHEAIDWEAFGSSLDRLEELVVIAKYANELVVPIERMPALREVKLQLSAYPQQTETLAIVERACSSIVGPVVHLALHSLQVPIDAIVANPALAALETLSVHNGTFRGAELLRGLDKLRVVHATNARDGLARAIVDCPTIEELYVTGFEVTDDYLALLADSDLKLRSLRIDEIGQAPYGDRGVLALVRGRSTANIETVKLRAYSLEPKTAIELAASSRPAFRQLVNEHAYNGWHPKVMMRPVATLWPDPPPGIERRFFVETVEMCTYCGGSGWSAGEGHCPMHYDDELDVREVSAPPDELRVAAIARIEAACLAIEPATREIHWHHRDREFRNDLPPKPFDAIPMGIDARCDAWPHILKATTNDPRADHAIALFELGVRILKIENGIVDLLVVAD